MRDPELLRWNMMAGSSAVRSAPERSGKSILVIDDDTEGRDLLAYLLRRKGHRVVTCSNGADALGYMSSSPLPNVILLDLQMPVMDGYEFRARQLAHRELASIPVVVISDQPSVDSTRIRGAMVMPKPFRVDELLAVLEPTVFADQARIKMLAGAD
jgi:CheY-like chemotaxis protein